MIPKTVNMDDNLDRYVLIDNWAKAAKYVDFTRAHESAKDYVSIAGKWEDKTGFFDFKTEGTKTIARAKEGAGACAQHRPCRGGQKYLVQD